MKKQLLVGAFMLASFFTAQAQVQFALLDENDQPLSWDGAYFGSLGAAGAFTGSLTGIDVDVVLEASTDNTWAADLAVLVATGLGQTDEIAIQLGGSSDFGATVEGLPFVGGQSADAGTTLTESLDLTEPFLLTDTAYRIFIGNGYYNADVEGANSGTWSGTVLFKGINLASAGIDENDINGLAVFPNPANDVVNVMNNNNILVSNVAIVDLNGRTVKSVKFDGVSQASVNVSDLASGVYMVNISSDKGMTTRKIVKN